MVYLIDLDNENTALNKDQIEEDKNNILDVSSTSSKEKKNKKEKGINLKEFKKAFNSLPKPVINHSRRVMKIAKFILSQFEIEDWYIDLNLKQDIVLKAIYYHDAGKTKLKKEYLFKGLCNGPAEVHKYYEHVRYGLEYIPEGYKPHTFEAYLFEAIKYHHPNDEDIPFVGSISFIANLVDNLCYKEESDIEKNLTDDEYYKVVDKIKVEIEKRPSLKIIGEYFQENTFVDKFLSFIKTMYRRADNRIRFGLNIENYKIFDIYKQSDLLSENANQTSNDTNEVYGNMITYAIKSRYYGLVKHKEFAYVANKNNLSSNLDNLFITDLANDIEDKKYVFDKLVFINLSLRSLNKLFIKRLYKLPTILNVKEEDIVILFDIFESKIEDSKASLINELKEANFKVGLNDVRTEYLELFKQVQFDYAFYDNFKTNEVDNILVNLIQSLGTIIVLTKQTDEKFRYVLDKSNSKFKVSIEGSDDIG